MQECGKSGLQFVETGEDPAKLFDLPDKTFDGMALFIGREVAISLMVSVCLQRNNGEDPLISDGLDRVAGMADQWAGTCSGDFPLSNAVKMG